MFLLRTRRFVAATIMIVAIIAVTIPLNISTIFAFDNPATTIFINEFHYDNNSTDTGEFVEIAAPTGTDLTGWSLYLYNGSNGAVYDSTTLPTATGTCDSYDLYVISYPSNGLQNGSPDGMALVDSAGTVVQFLSYEGTFTVADGPANGSNSTDIGVTESGATQIGESLQLSGTGTTYGEFTWQSAAAETPGACNTGQTIGTPVDVPPTVTSTSPANSDSGVAVNSSLIVNFSEDVTVSGSWYDITCGTSAVTATVTGGAQSYTLTPDSALPASETCTVEIAAAQVADQDGTADNMAADYSWSFTTAGAVATNVFINEMDADQAGTDSAEFVELYDGGSGNTSLTGLVLVLFNGNGDISYRATDLDGYTTGADGYFVICGNASNVANCDLDITPDTNLIQNGADAVALYTGSDTDFPNDTAVTIANLIDAIVYDTDDSDDAGLLALLNAGQPQINENGGGDGPAHSNQRCSNGDGGLRNTSTYTQAAPSPGSTNTCSSSGSASAVCGDPATLISTIQGSGTSSPEDGVIHAIEGVVVGDFQTGSSLSGFFVQEQDADADADPTTSEGIFVYDGASPAVDVSVGNIVRVVGKVTEYSDLTELSNISSVSICGTGGSATSATVSLPVSDVGDWEWYEGMLINIPQTLFVTGNYTQGRYGEVDLSVNDRLYNPTNVVPPGTAANTLRDINNRSRIQLDDGASTQNPSPPPYMGTGNTLRAGDTIPDLTGVLHYSYGAYEVHPTGAVSFTRVNNRTAVPANVGGTLRVASFNVLNYFTTLDDSGDICGPTGGMECRGADTAAEFTRQRDKIISALIAMDADVIGLMEMENHPTDAALQDLVNGLNTVAGAGTYDYLATGSIGTDAIKVAIIYKPGTVTPVGSFAILDSSVDPIFIDTKNRPSLAQTFQENATGGVVTVVVNHLKSKGSACDALGDSDTGDLQGNCNITRTNAATALVNWLATDPTSSGDPDYLIIGDMNAYAMEDPITVIKNGGYTNLISAFIGNGYSYSYDGEVGYLDHALSSSSLTGQVAGVTEWHINSDEPVALDYNEYNEASLYQPNAYAASDHDPVVVGLNLSSTTSIDDADSSNDSVAIVNDTDLEPTITDPALSKIGVLLPGQLGLPGEQVTWVITVAAPTGGSLENVVVTDMLVPELQIDDVQANGIVAVNGQEVSVTIPFMAAGSTTDIRIRTTILRNPDAPAIENTAVLSLFGDTLDSATSLIYPVRSLPSTGYPPAEH